MKKQILQRIIDSLEHDNFINAYDFEIVSDETIDLMGFTLDNLKWNEQQFNSIMKCIDNIKVENDNFNIYTSYDVSGFDYWCNNMCENMYCMLTIEFKNTFKLNIDNLKDDLKVCIDLLEKYCI